MAWKVRQRWRSKSCALYARYGVPYLWLVDPVARAVEAYVLHASEYALAARVSGSEPVDLPPFTDFGLAPSSLWP